MHNAPHTEGFNQKGDNYMFTLRRADQLFNAIYVQEAGGKAEITEPQYHVLQALSDQGPLIQLALVEHTGIDRSTLSVLLPPFADKGYISIETFDSDARAKLIKLTKQGRSALNATRKTMGRAEEAFFLPLSLPDRIKFNKLLVTLVETAKEKTIRPRRASVRHRNKLRAQHAARV